MSGENDNSEDLSYREQYGYDEFDFDDATLLDLNSDITDLIDQGQYDQAQDIITERLEKEPLNPILHKMYIQVLDQRNMIPDFPGDSSETKLLKQRFLNLIKQSQIELSDVDQIKYSQMIFNKFFYFVEYPNETILDTLIAEIPDFNLFKNN